MRTRDRVKFLVILILMGLSISLIELIVAAWTGAT